MYYIYYWVLIWTFSALRVCRISNYSYGWYGVVASAVIDTLVDVLVVAKRVRKVVFMNYNHGYPLLSQRGPVSVSRRIGIKILRRSYSVKIPGVPLLCYAHNGMCDIRYLVRAFTKARRGPCGVLLISLTWAYG